MVLLVRTVYHIHAYDPEMLVIGGGIIKVKM
jgi:hypothetical protein